MPDRRELVEAAERAVIGSIVSHPAAITEALAVLAGDDFADPRHEHIFVAAAAVHFRGASVGHVTVLDQLTRDGTLRGNLTNGYLIGIGADACLPVQVGHHAEIIVREAKRRTLESEYRRGLQALDVTEGDDLDEVVRGLQRQLTMFSLTSTASTAPFDKFAFDGWGFLKHQGADIEPVWGRRGTVAWPMGEACMIAGPSGVGKTTIAHQVLLGRLGIGGDVLGMPVQPTGKKVLYLAMDRPMQIARAFSRLVQDEHENLLRDHLVWWGGPLPATLESEPWVLAELAEHHGADTIIVDSIKDTIQKVSADESGNAYNRARQNALAEGFQLLELHHNRKGMAGAAREENIDAIYGSAWLVNGAGSVFGLFGDPGDPVVRMRHLKQSSGDLGSFEVRHDFDRGVSAIDAAADPLALMRQNADGLSPQEFAWAVNGSADKPTRNDIEKARRKLDSLVAKGLATKVDGMRGGADGGQSTRYFGRAEESPN
jgi:replicative DNA helicase